MRRLAGTCLVSEAVVSEKARRFQSRGRTYYNLSKARFDSFVVEKAHSRFMIPCQQAALYSVTLVVSIH